MKTVLVCVLGALVTTVAAAGTPPAMPPSDFGGAKPLNIESWYSYEDFPKAAIRAREEGVVTIGFDIGVNGRMTNCVVTRSSGSAALDAVPCEKVTRRARFRPAKNAAGVPVVTHGTTSFYFSLP